MKKVLLIVWKIIKGNLMLDVLFLAFCGCGEVLRAWSWDRYRLSAFPEAVTDEFRYAVKCYKELFE